MKPLMIMVILCLILLVAVMLLCHRINEIKSRSFAILETLIGVIETGDPNLDGHSIHVYHMI